MYYFRNLTLYYIFLFINIENYLYSNIKKNKARKPSLEKNLKIQESALSLVLLIREGANFPTIKEIPFMIHDLEAFPSS